MMMMIGCFRAARFARASVRAGDGDACARDVSSASRMDVCVCAMRVTDGDVVDGRCVGCETYSGELEGADYDLRERRRGSDFESFIV